MKKKQLVELVKNAIKVAQAELFEKRKEGYPADLSSEESISRIVAAIIQSAAINPGFLGALLEEEDEDIKN